MKTNFKSSFIAIAVFIFAAFSISSILISCSEDNLTISNGKLIDELESFNHSFLDSKSPNEGDYIAFGFWDDLKKGIAIAGADLVGAGAGVAAVKEIALVAGVSTGGTGGAIVIIAGGVVGGASGSILASNQLNSTENFGTLQVHQNLDINYPEKYMHFSNAGQQHNDMVVEMNNNQIGSILIENEDLHNGLIDDVNFSPIIEKINNISSQYAKRDYQVEFLLNETYSQGLITKAMKDVFSHFFYAYNQITEIEEFKKIIDFYILTVANSNELNETEKEALIISFSVAAESPFFWIHQINDL